MAEFSNEPVDATGSTAGKTTSERPRLLARERRRLVIEILAGETPPTDLEALTTEIVARESDHGATSGTSIEHIRVTLHHVHLPKLAEVGVIDYDPETHRIDPDTGFLASYCL